MERGMSILLAGGVLAAGTLVALLFRHPSSGSPPPLPEGARQLVLRNCTPDPPHAEEPRARLGQGSGVAEMGPIVPAPLPGREAFVLTPSEPAKSPPSLAKSYPASPMPAAAGWGSPMVMMPARSGSASAPVTHKIVDGDTLRSLAERYLGSADRSGEILEANRDVLANPEILPIGLELKIPGKSGE